MTLTNAPECPATQSYLASRILPDGRVMTLMPLFGDRARLTLGWGWTSYDDAW